MSKVIEIVVIGGTGSGKSHVLELIDKALRDGYGPHVQVVSRDLALERALGGPGAKPSADTIFSLKERQPGVEPTVSTLKIDVDTSDIDSTLGKLDLLSGAVGYAELGNALRAYTFDPLESAIEVTTRLLTDEHERLKEAPANGVKSGAVLLDRLGGHLDDLLSLQLKRLSAEAEDKDLAKAVRGITWRLERIIADRHAGL